ncbi:glutathione S-transferase family protein [Hasllibacter sp. MH4015]|uniref:glutathione S-transferase family protein n=1 Tax=Hasllibacter sp. MH4015 TaxID=2854029 RepID=UPI001CD46B1B|nr:glutathione S-transferase [Hasllibacter sp. MH4015]
MSDYKVFGGIRSRAMRVIWIMEELGLDYELIAAAPRSPEVRALNPTGKVPVLVDDGTAIPDSVAIMTYLADKHGAMTHAPGTLNRARQDAFTQLVVDEIDAILWTAARHSFILPEDQRVPAVKESLRWEFAVNQETVAGRMDADGPFVLGEQITLADILLSHCIGWARNAKFEVTNARLLDHDAMMKARPAFKAAVAKGS